MADCQDRDVVFFLKDIFGSNDSAWDKALDPGGCGPSYNSSDGTSHALNLSSLWGLNPAKDSYFGKDFYAYVTPFIVVIGVIGNVISLLVFTSKRMRKLPASMYLAAISTSDTLVLLTYVLLDWLNKGLPRWPGSHRLPLVNTVGVCQTFLFVSYTFRFTSVWLIVIFTVERYVAVCRPLHRRVYCTKRFSRKTIISTTVIGSALSLYKPILSGVHTMASARICSANPDTTFANFILDSLYGLVITALPFVLITLLNSLILRALLKRSFANTGRAMRALFKENKVRLEFTLILLAISTCFICLNIPYFIVWCQQFLATAGMLNNMAPGIDTETGDVTTVNSSDLYITRTIFYLNYAINFLLYSITGRQYRHSVKSLFIRRREDSLREGSFGNNRSYYYTRTTSISVRKHSL